MSEPSHSATPGAFPIAGVVSESRRNVLRKRLENAKREHIEALLGKGESWVTKVLNNGAGVQLDDLPLLADALGLKLVDKAKVCVDPEIARAYDAIVRKKTEAGSLLFEDAE